MKQDSGSIYNIVTILFLVLSVVSCLCTALVATDTVTLPDSLQKPTDVPLPPTYVPPSPTPSLTPTQPPPPTWTPSPPPGATQPPADESSDGSSEATPVIAPT